MFQQEPFVVFGPDHATEAGTRFDEDYLKSLPGCFGQFHQPVRG